ncbi:MAG: hypothetical protein QF464_11475, partial [Myxococcota bacterium]|nr:hypothetical protein [Myxococcota bacterium]
MKHALPWLILVMLAASTAGCFEVPEDPVWLPSGDADVTVAPDTTPDILTPDVPTTEPDVPTTDPCVLQACTAQGEVACVSGDAGQLHVRICGPDDACDGMTWADAGLGCEIAGICRVEGEADPLSACETCQPSLATDAYSDAPSGTLCDDDDVCSEASACDGAGACAGTGSPLSCDDGLGCTVDQCDPIDGCTSSPATITKVYEDPEANTGGGPIATTDDDGLVFATHGTGILDGGVESFAIRRLSATGESVWTTPFTAFPLGARAHDIAALPDGGFVVAGEATVSAGSTVGLVVWMDADGQVGTTWTTDGACVGGAPCGFVAGPAGFSSVAVSPTGELAVVGTIEVVDTLASPEFTGLLVRFDAALQVTKTTEFGACFSFSDQTGVSLYTARYLDGDAPGVNAD